MGEQSKTKIEQTELDRVLAVPMFVVAVLFLVLSGIYIHLANILGGPDDYASSLRQYCLIGMAVLYLLYIGETIAHVVSGSNCLKQNFVCLLIPWLRLCPRDHVDGSHAWIVGYGWRRTTQRLERYLSRVFSGPMIVIALLVLPLVGAELLLKDKFEGNANLKFALDIATSLIWMAFVFEFVVMVTVVEKKFRYCKQNWIDLAIILLPLIAFLRAARLGRLLKLQQLSRTAKVYRVRGLALRGWRAIVTLDVIDKLLRRDPTYRIDKLEAQVREREDEIRHLQVELERLRLIAREKIATKKREGAEDGLNEPLELNFSYTKKD